MSKMPYCHPLRPLRDGICQKSNSLCPTILLCTFLQVLSSLKKLATHEWEHTKMGILLRLVPSSVIIVSMFRGTVLYSFPGFCYVSP